MKYFDIVIVLSFKFIYFFIFSFAEWFQAHHEARSYLRWSSPSSANPMLSAVNDLAHIPRSDARQAFRGKPDPDSHSGLSAWPVRWSETFNIFTESGRNWKRSTRIWLRSSTRSDTSPSSRPTNPPSSPATRAASKSPPSPSTRAWPRSWAETFTTRQFRTSRWPDSLSKSSSWCWPTSSCRTRSSRRSWSAGRRAWRGRARVSRRWARTLCKRWEAQQQQQQAACTKQQQQQQQQQQLRKKSVQKHKQKKEHVSLSNLVIRNVLHKIVSIEMCFHNIIGSVRVSPRCSAACKNGKVYKI